LPQDETFYKPSSSAKAVDLRSYLESPETASPTISNLTILPQAQCRGIIKEKGWENFYPSPGHSFCAGKFIHSESGIFRLQNDTKK
jgi:hypothetical protein